MPLKSQIKINPKFYFCGVHAAFFVFPLACAVKKHLVSEKPLNKRFFKSTGVVLAGIECSPKISDFRASGIPVQERVDFLRHAHQPAGLKALQVGLFLLFCFGCSGNLLFWPVGLF